MGVWPFSRLVFDSQRGLHIEPFFGSRRVMEVTSDPVAKYVAEALKKLEAS